MQEEIELWDNLKAVVDFSEVNNNSLDVKGEIYNNPSRCLEIYTETKEPKNSLLKLKLEFNNSKDTCFIPFLEDFIVPVGEKIKHPPYSWNDTDPSLIISNFIYNTNAIYRILKNLERQDLLSSSEIDNLLDEACKTLCSIYKYSNNFIIKHINNNINMSLITKIIELNLGQSVFKITNQESGLTSASLYSTLSEIEQFHDYDIYQLMAISIGRGRVFYNELLNDKKLRPANNIRLNADQTFKYIGKEPVIDHRYHLIERIIKSNDEGKIIKMSVILDDTSESVLDLLWIQKLLITYKFLEVYLILNKAQVSINFSSHMLNPVLQNPFFKELASKLNNQLKVHVMNCPLISFQTNLLDDNTLKIIHKTNLTFVKGLNFFETFQILEQDVYYAFIVSSYISRIYTGLNNGDAVFAYVPAYKTGYLHNKEKCKIKTLKNIND
jgi:hypothetical protein